MVNVLFMCLPVSEYLLNQQLYKILMHVLQCVLLCCTMYCPVKSFKELLDKRQDEIHKKTFYEFIKFHFYQTYL